MIFNKRFIGTALEQIWLREDLLNEKTMTTGTIYKFNNGDRLQAGCLEYTFKC